MLGASHAVLLGACKVGAPFTYVGRVLGYNPDWYLPLAETSGTVATAQVGANGTYQNSPQLGVTSIAQDDTSGRSVGLSGATSSTPHITATSPLSAASFTIDMIVQLDDITKPKHVLLTHSGGLATGQVSIEVVTGGAVRCFSDDSLNAAHVIQSATGVVPQGEAVKITYQRQSNVPGWSQRAYVNGVLVAEDTTQRTWDAFAAGTVYIGTWWDGANFLDPTDGLIAHVAGWNSLLTPNQISSLVRPQSVAWAEDIDADAVQADTSKVISVRQGGWHGKTPFIATAEDGALVTTTESGEDITILAGSTTGTDDTFSYSFTDANGNSSPTKTVTIDVTEAAAGVSIGALTAFQPSRIQVTALSGWPAGRTPKEVVTQGTYAYGYARRPWKPTDNDGTWMDFQAGWRKTLSSGTVRIKLDNNSELDLSYTVNHTIPSPGSGGTTRTLDKLGGADFTTWTAAITGCNNNDVLVVRARAGGEVYPVDVQVGGANSTASGVKVVAHPDDLAAGRRPRIHVQGTTFARYADDLNNNHWVVHSNLGGNHGTIYRSAVPVGTDKVNIGAGYLSVGGKIKRCFTYTNTPSTPGALARLQDTSYPRISRTLSTWNLYMGPGIYLHTDGYLYIRLTPLTDGIGARAVGQSAGPNPPFNWSDDAPVNTNPNLCQLYISSTNDYNAETTQPTNGLNYCLRINNTSNWSIENLDFVGGGNTIEMNWGTNHILRGCRVLGWAPPNMAGEDNTASTVGRVHNMLETEGTHGLLCDRCEFYGGMPPWHGWEENKAMWGAYSIAQKINLWWMDDGTSDSWSGTFRYCIIDGFALLNRRNGKLRYFKLHHSRLSYCGMDGLIGSQVPWQTYECLRSQMFECSFGGWLDESAVDGTMYVGHSLITAFRPYIHDSAYWDSSHAGADNQFVCIRQTIGHGVSPGYKELEKQYWYNNTAIGSTIHQRSSVRKIGANMVHDGAGAFIFPYNKNDLLVDYYSRNNILATRPNGCIGSLDETRDETWGDSHTGVVLHQAMVGNGNTAGGTPTLNEYSMDYNCYHRGAGMETVTGHNTVITTVNNGGSEQARTTMAQVQGDTDQEAHGIIADPVFAGTWDASQPDSILHQNAPWCLTASSPSEVRTGGNNTDRSWLDADFGTVVSYGGNSWRGCMDPAASAVEQQVGPLGPVPSEL